MRPRSPILQGLLAGLTAVAPVAVLLIVPGGLLRGGTWLWLPALAFVAVYGAVSLAANIALAVKRPANFQVRQQGVVAAKARRQPLIDAVGAAALIVYGCAWLAFIPLDVFALHIWPRPAPWICALGGLAALAGAALYHLAVWQNRFATPNVQDQSDAGQVVIDTGVYAVIRHPLYAANLLLFGGLALWLGSWAAFAGLAVLLAATVARIAIEEAHLRANLPGYAAYARRVRGRLVPGLL